MPVSEIAELAMTVCVHNYYIIQPDVCGSATTTRHDYT